MVCHHIQKGGPRGILVDVWRGRCNSEMEVIIQGGVRLTYRNMEIREYSSCTSGCYGGPRLLLVVHVDTEVL